VPERVRRHCDSSNRTPGVFHLFPGILQQSRVPVREREFRANQIFVQGDVELVRYAFRRRVLDGQTGVLGERVGRPKRAGHTRSELSRRYGRQTYFLTPTSVHEIQVWDVIRTVRCLWEGNLNKALSIALNIGMLNQEVVTFSGDTATARLDIQVTRKLFLVRRQSGFFVFRNHEPSSVARTQSYRFIPYTPSYMVTVLHSRAIFFLSSARVLAKFRFVPHPSPRLRLVRRKTNRNAEFPLSSPTGSTKTKDSFTVIIIIIIIIIGYVR